MDIQTLEQMPEIRELAIIPPNSVIPQLQQFQDAPYKFERIALTIEFTVDYVERDFVFAIYDCLISVRERRMVWLTRTHKNLYSMPLPLEIFPEELKYYQAEKERANGMTFLDLIQEWFKPIITVLEETKQGNLEIARIRELNLSKYAKPYLDNENNWITNIYEHKITSENQDFYLYEFPQFPEYFLLSANEQVRLSHPQHKTIELREGTYLLYHPEPTKD